MSFDEVFDHLGAFGIYQKRLLLLMCIPMLFVGFEMMAGVFLLDIPDYRCNIPGMDNDTYEIKGTDHEAQLNNSIPLVQENGAWSRDSCHVIVQDGNWNKTMECDEWVYDQSGVKNNVITEFNLVCDQLYLRSLANSVLMAGLLLGSLVLGVLSDYFGRRPTLLFAIILNVVSGVALAFSPNFVVFIVLRFINGAVTISMNMPAFIISMEFIGPSKRTLAAMVQGLFVCIGTLILGGLAYWFRDWRHLQLVISVPSGLLLAYYWLVPESPRWLLSRGREKEAEKILKKAAEMNRVTIPEKLFEGSRDVHAPASSIRGMFSSPSLVIRTLIIFYQWLVASVVFYGLALNVGNLAGDIYLNFTIGGIVDSSTYFSCYALLDRVGRRPMHAGNMLLGGVACLCTIFPALFGGSDLQWMMTALSMVGRFGVSTVFAVIYIYTAELFPTVVRNSGMGASSFSSRIGGIISPYIADLGNMVEGNLSGALPQIVFGSAAVLAGVLSLWLPETRNQKFPETIADVKAFRSRPMPIAPERGSRVENPSDSLGVNKAFEIENP